MNTFCIVVVLACSIVFNTNPLHAKQSTSLHNWLKQVNIPSTARQPARTAVLIIAPPIMGDCFVENRWKLGKAVWEQYMNSHPNVDCYFLQTTVPRSGHTEQVWIEGNTLYIGDPWYEQYRSDRLLYKTIVAMEWLLPYYTHFIRTNLNTFIDLKGVNEYMETHHNSFYTTPLWHQGWYTIGYAIFFTADVASHMISEYRRLADCQEELISPEHADDGALSALATGVWPLTRHNPFRCCPSLPAGSQQLMDKQSFSTTTYGKYGVLLIPPISLKEAIHRCSQAPDTALLYRINNKLSLYELADLYQYLTNKHYPELSCASFREFVDSLHTQNINP